MFVKRDQQPQRLRCQPLGEDGIGWAIAFADTVRRQPPWRAFGLDLIFRLAERQRFGLCKQITTSGDHDDGLIGFNAWQKPMKSHGTTCVPGG